jgi:hypothetical protein
MVLMHSLLRWSRDRLRPELRAYTRPLLIVASIILVWLGANQLYAGNVINYAATGTSGTAITVSNTAPTQLLKANSSRYGWTIFCSGTAGSIAVMVEPGDSSGNPAGTAANTVAPSQTIGFPIPANTLISDQDFPMRGLDALHQRLDAEAQGGSPVNCYTWEEN